MYGSGARGTWPVCPKKSLNLHFARDSSPVSSVARLQVFKRGKRRRRLGLIVRCSVDLVRCQIPTADAAGVPVVGGDQQPARETSMDRVVDDLLEVDHAVFDVVGIEVG